MSNRNLEQFLSLLEKVKQTGADSFVACCPAHDDHSPSLSIRETDDGTVLLHCFAGCPAAEVLAAVGLEFSALFPETPHHHGKRKRLPFNPREVLQIMARESLLVAMGADQIARGHPIASEDVERLMRAAERLQRASEVANGSK